MTKKTLTLSLLIFTLFTLTGCTKTEKDVDNQYASSSPEEKNTQTANSAEVLNIIGDTNDIGELMDMRIRRKVDDIYLDDEGKGYTIRISKEDSKITDITETINETMQKEGFKKSEYKAKNPSSDVTTFIKYSKSNVTCTLEVKEIGNTGNSDLSFGCL